MNRRTSSLMNRCDKGHSKQSLQTRACCSCSTLPALDSDRRQHTALWGYPLSPSTAKLVLDLGMWAKRGGQAMFGASVLRQNENDGKRGKQDKTKSSVLLLSYLFTRSPCHEILKLAPSDAVFTYWGRSALSRSHAAGWGHRGKKARACRGSEGF